MCLGDIDKFLLELPLKDKDISSLSYKKIGKLFVWYYLCYHFSGNKISKIYYLAIFLLGRQQSIIIIVKNMVKNIYDEIIDYATLDEYYIYVAKNILMLKDEPCLIYQRIKSRSEADINELKTRILYFEKNQTALLNDNLKKVDEKNYEKYLIQHFINRNKEALTEIETFMKFKINIWCLNKSINTFGLELFEFPYNYAWWPSRFTIQEEYKFFNKFQELPFNEFRRIIAEYKIDENTIYDNANNYIEQHNILDKCIFLLNCNHILYERMSIIKKILSFYNNDNFIFCNLVYSQIEGLFYEYCKYIGCTDDNLLSTSISSKAKLLFDNKLIDRYTFDYYAHMFPITRNRLAHGIEFDLEFSKIAKMLLLDLYHTLNISLSNEFDYNYIIKTIENVEKEKNFDYITNYCLIIGKKLNKYYALDEKIEKLNIEINWGSYLDELFDKCLTWDVYRTAKIVSINLKRKSIMSDKCIEILRKIGNKDISKFDNKEHLLGFIRK
jgi:hypothetical protein